MNVAKQAFTEILQSYKLIFSPIISRWRVRTAIKIANSEFKRTGRQYFVLHSEDHDCEVLSKVQLDWRLHELKKKNKRFKDYTIQDIQKQCIYMTPAKIYSGNLTALGFQVEKSKPVRIKYKRK